MNFANICVKLSKNKPYSGNGAHSDNERISEEAMVDFVKFMWTVVIDIAVSD